jgi:vancomycin resistance protein YoaR
MSKVDWSKAPEWATCVVKRPGLKEDHHWSEKPMNDAQLHHIKTGSTYTMGNPNCWDIVEQRPTESDVIITGREPMSPADLHLAHLFTPAKQPSTAPDLLQQAGQLLAERGQQYDKSGNERSAAKIVAAFNTITGRDLTPGEGWLFLTLLKAVRFYSNTETPHRDSLEDMIAYAALHAEEYLNDN